MPESFGARLRQQRERQQIALSAIAEQTKIKLSLLEGLERDDLSHWPAGIFRRAFVRAYAGAIALEPDVVVREFVELHPDPIDVDSTVSTVMPAGDEVSARTAPPTRLHYLVDSAMNALSRPRFGIVPRRLSAVEHLAAAACAPVTAADCAPVAAGDRVPEAAGDCAPACAPAAPEPDLLAVAQLCTELGRVDETGEVAPMLQEAARILDAVGLILWVWHPQATELRPALAQGYSDTVLAQLPKVKRDTANATAAAFRSAQTCVVNGGDLSSGAVVVPLMTAVGCVGVLAIELRDGNEQRESTRALGTIFAAQLARVVGAARPAEAGDRRLA
jgi:helix-turn-helix protein